MSPQQQLEIMSKQLENLQKVTMNIQRLVAMPNGGTPRVVRQPVIVGVKDITSAQLFDAYKKGLNMEQLCQLADGKYTAEQIYKKLQKLGVQ